ncbi:hypothetical protein [uncultured Ruegeria sp.]|uniref:hypothetical protein n=1 Tax=uncultured Ruegeria sp. TaxID=259304 RepID=UPI002616563C|nr:hypothetical protein [uncultured Ruegeria sp.]
MKGLVKLLLFSMFGASIAPCMLLAAPDWKCLQPALKEELNRKLIFQDDFAELVSAERPEFADVAQLGADASKINFEMRLSRIKWLWNEEPSRLSDPEDLWVFDWSDADMIKWLEADPDNLSSFERFDELQASLSGHPSLPEFRSYVSDNKAVSPYLELYSAFGEDIRSDRDKVANCF